MRRKNRTETRANDMGEDVGRGLGSRAQGKGNRTGANLCPSENAVASDRGCKGADVRKAANPEARWVVLGREIVGDRRQDHGGPEPKSIHISWKEGDQKQFEVEGAHQNAR